ncbi:MAG TPA: type II toxin-antitoxin system VapC family toxin [Thermoanaerobaculia bacterium]|jgi:tRNA(fMet)-specific endonuclease VapC|nr:type II toxin-antitoxin system VapC family toxin [Thermoanaerobaculia bacterium]
MLDTDSVSFALRGQGRVAQRILQHRPSQICISSITLAELRYGATRRSSRKLHEVIDAFTADVAVMAFDDACAGLFGVIAAELAKRGAVIGEFDALIAAHAVALDLTLVTNNVRHFARVRGLRVENWS